MKEEKKKKTDGDTVIKKATEINRKDKTEVDSVFEITRKRLKMIRLSWEQILPFWMIRNCARNIWTV